MNAGRTVFAQDYLTPKQLQLLYYDRTQVKETMYEST